MSVASTENQHSDDTQNDQTLQPADVSESSEPSPERRESIGNVDNSPDDRVGDTLAKDNNSVDSETPEEIPLPSDPVEEVANIDVNEVNVSSNEVSRGTSENNDESESFPDVSESARVEGDGESINDGDDEGDDDIEDLTEDLNGDESMAQEEKLLEEMLRLKLTTNSGAAAMLPPKQRIKLYQPRSKLEQFEDILIESQLLEQNISGLVKKSPLDYEKFDLDNMSLQEAINGMTDFDTSDAIFAEPGDDRPEVDQVDGEYVDSNQESACECESCVERSALAVEQAKETKRLQQCWLEVREDFRTVYKMVLEGAWNDTNRTRPDLNCMKEKIQRLVWRDPHQLYQRLEAQIKELVLDMKAKLIDLLQKQAKNPSLAQEFISDLLSGHERLCEASKIVSVILSDLEMDHLRRFSLTWELLNKHIFQAVIYTDPLIQNNLPIFISQLRSLYPNKEHEERYTELVRGYLDFDVEMENVGVFWSGSEALLLEYSVEQQQLREKQKMLKHDWERFKTQRKQIQDKLLDKPTASGGGSELPDDTEDVEETGRTCKLVDESQPCECHVCTAPSSKEDMPTIDGTLFPTTPDHHGTTEPPTSLYPHLYNLPSASSVSQTTTTSTNSFSSVIGSVADLSAALSSALHLTTSSSTMTTAHPPPPVPAPTHPPPPLPSHTQPTVSQSPPHPSPPKQSPPKPSLAKDYRTAPPTGPPPVPVSRPTDLPLPTDVPPSNNTAGSTKSSTSTKPKAPPSCSHNHNNPNAKELKKLMGHDCNKKAQPRKSKSGSALSTVSGDLDDGESTEELSDNSSPEDSCSSSTSGATDKHCACCYCEVFGHGTPSVAPVSRNYPEMRERLRLLLSKKKKCKQNVGSRGDGGHKVVENSSTHGCTAGHQQPPPHHHPPPPPQKQYQQQQYQQQPPLKVANANVVKKQENPIKTKDVDEILEFIEGNQSSANEKKRMKKERQKQQRLEELKKKQEEERIRKQAEEAARKKKEEEEKLASELALKTAKKQKKKAAQKAKKAAAAGIPVETEDTPTGEPTELDLEGLRAQHLAEQQQLMEKQKIELMEQQRILEEKMQQAKQMSGQLKRNVKQAKKAPMASITPVSQQPTGIPSQRMYGNNGYQPGFQPTQPNFAPPYQQPPYYSQQQQQQQQPQHHYPPYQQQPPPPQQQSNFMPNVPQPRPPAPPPAKSDQPMVTIKRVIRPDSSEPTVTISVKKEEEKEPEEVLFTLVNGQVMKTNEAPDNLIPSAKQMPEELAKRILPERQLNPEATLSKKQRKKIKRQQQESSGNIPGLVGSLSNTTTTSTMGSQPTGNPEMVTVRPGFTQAGYQASLNQAAGQASKGPGPAPATGNRVPRMSDGKVDLNKLKLPEGISISKITGPVPERKYFPCKPAQEPERPQRVQNPSWTPPNFGGPGSMGGPGSSFAGGPMGPQYGGQMPPVGYPGSQGMNPNMNMGGNPNVIVVDTAQLTTREEEERQKREEDKTGKKKKNKKKKPTDSSESSSSSTSGAVPGATAYNAGQAYSNYPGMFGGGQPGFSPNAPMGFGAGGGMPAAFGGGAGGYGGYQPQPPAPKPEPRKSEWTPAQYGGYTPPASGGGSGRVLIKSVNGKVVITPVPDSGAPAQPAANNPPPPQAQPNKRPPAARKPTPVNPAPQPPRPAPVPAPVRQQAPPPQLTAARKIIKRPNLPSTSPGAAPSTNLIKPTPQAAVPQSSVPPVATLAPAATTLTAAPAQPIAPHPTAVLAPIGSRPSDNKPASNILVNGKQPSVNGKNGCCNHADVKTNDNNKINSSGSQNEENEGNENIPACGINGVLNGEEDSAAKNKKKSKKKRSGNPEERMDEINSIFAPKDGLDLNGGVDAADREIEQFKQFCFNSVPVQNRAKVNFDVKNIAFKKKT